MTLATCLLLVDTDLEKDKFEKLYYKYKDKMLFCANNILHDQHEAEDAVQNAFLGLAKNISVIGDVSSDKSASYVITATYNASFRLLEKRKSVNKRTDYNVEVEGCANIKDGDFFNQLPIHEKYDEVVQAIQALKPIYQDAMYMHFVLELSIEKTAKKLGIKISTANQRLMRGKKQILNKFKGGL